MTTATLEPPAPAKDSAPNKDSGPEAIYYVDVDRIEPDPKNRDKIDEAKVIALAENIRQVGLLQPIVLRYAPGGGWRIIAGEHRWRAYKHLGLKVIAARVFGGETELSAAMKKTAENALRVDLTPIEKAKRYQELQDLGASQKEIGVICGGISQPMIANALRLLTLPSDVQQLVANGELSEAHGVSLARFSRWPKVCSRMAKFANDHGYSSKDLNNERLPFINQLVDARLVEEIRCKNHWSGCDTPTYDLPCHFKSHADFIAGEYTSYYVLPEDPKDNVWAPEKKRQDDERARLEAARALKASKQAKDGKPTKEALERRKAIERNKAIRDTNTSAYRASCENLKRIQEPTALLVGIIIEAAIAGGYHHKRIAQAAADVGVTLPKNLLSDGGGQGVRNLPAMASMDTMSLTRLAVAVLLNKQTDDANKNPCGLPEAVGLVSKLKVKQPIFSAGDTVAWEGCKGVITGKVVTVPKRPKVLKDSTPVRVTAGEETLGRVADVLNSALWLVASGKGGLK